MKSKIPAVARKYFESVGVDLDKHHPVVHAWFRPGRGWLPTLKAVPVSHAYLVRIRDNHGVAEVCLKAPNPGGHDNLPDFSLKHLIGDMTALDAEVADGVPVSEGVGVTGTLDQISAILTEIGIGLEDQQKFFTQAAVAGETEFTVERREFSVVDARGQLAERWGYRLANHGMIDDCPAYRLECTSHAEKVTV